MALYDLTEALTALRGSHVCVAPNLSHTFKDRQRQLGKFHSNIYNVDGSLFVPATLTLHNFSHRVRSAESVVEAGSFFVCDPILAPTAAATHVSVTSSMELQETEGMDKNVE